MLLYSYLIRAIRKPDWFFWIRFASVKGFLRLVDIVVYGSFWLTVGLGPDYLPIALALGTVLNGSFDFFGQKLLAFRNSYRGPVLLTLEFAIYIVPKGLIAYVAGILIGHVENLLPAATHPIAGKIMCIVLLVAVIYQWQRWFFDTDRNARLNQILSTALRNNPLAIYFQWKTSSGHRHS